MSVDLILKALKFCGFSSEPKEQYHPLGDPITDPQELIFTALGMQKYHESINHQNGKTASQEVMGYSDVLAGDRTKMIRQSSDGYAYLKKKISASMKRVVSCKLGSFDRICSENTQNKPQELVERVKEENDCISNGSTYYIYL